MLELKVLTNGDKVYGADEVDAVLKAKDSMIKEFTKSHLQEFYEFGGNEEEDPIEQLRFFCSLVMNAKDWLDVEQFFDRLTKCAEDENKK